MHLVINHALANLARKIKSIQHVYFNNLMMEYVVAIEMKKYFDQENSLGPLKL